MAEVERAFAIAAIDDVAAVLGDRRADAGFDQFLDLVDDVGVGRVFLDRRGRRRRGCRRRVPAANNGAPLTKWSSSMPTTCGSSVIPRRAGRGGDRNEVAAEEHAFDHRRSRTARRRAARLRPTRASGKSRLPASITGWPGRNLRVAGLGVCSVWISMRGDVALRPRRYQGPKRRRPGDDPAGDGERGRAGTARPPTIWPGRIGATAGLKRGRPAADHRPDQLLAAHQPVIEDRRDVQRRSAPGRR